VVKCEHLKELLDAEISIIKKHLDNHKWCNHIPDDNYGIQDFVNKYGWLMREFYCGFVCEHRETCPLKSVTAEAPEEAKKKDPRIFVVNEE
jgi:hypothetical protein